MHSCDRGLPKTPPGDASVDATPICKDLSGFTSHEATFSRTRRAWAATRRGRVQVYTEVEDWVSREKFGVMRYPSLATTPHGRISEEICTAAANLAGQLNAKAILVYTHTGTTAGYVSRRRPDCPIIAITGALQ